MPNRWTRCNQWTRIVINWKTNELKMIQEIDKKKSKKNNHQSQRHNQER
jgi:DNA replication protein DnaD